MTCFRFLGLLTTAVVLLATGDASAVSRTWTGGAGDNVWTTPGNWDPAGFATSDDLAVSTTVALAAGSASVQVAGDGSLTITPAGVLNVTGTGDLRLQGNAILNIEGTLQRTSGSNWFRFGDNGNLNATINHTGTFSSTSPPMIAFNQLADSGQATYNITAGTLSTTSYMVLGWSYATNSGNMLGTVNQSGDSVVNVGSYVALGQSNSANTVGGTGTGYYNISGGVLNASSVRVGYWATGVNSDGAGTGVFTQTGGTVGATTRPDVFVAYGDLSTGTYVMRGGTLNARDLTDNGVGAASVLKIQGGAGTIDVSRDFSFTGDNATLAVEVGSTGLTAIQVSGTGTANVGTSTDLTAGVYGGAALSASDTFTVLQLASGSIDGSLVDQSGPLWTLSQDSDRVDLTLAPGAGKGTIAVPSALTGLDDSFGWISIPAGDFDFDVFLLELELAGTGSVTDLAHWMTEAGLNATADSVANTITLADLPVPSGGPSYFFWDLRDYNSSFGTTFAVSAVSAIPEPSALVLGLIALLCLGAAPRRRRKNTVVTG
ncbi:MAG: hypothetical protein RBS80_26695 [Thermoguttaceae bacterium]|jgi:hypothetical protein|nr:hypothetical protein [Thermoguttaceae bacterium]